MQSANDAGPVRGGIEDVLQNRRERRSVSLFRAIVSGSNVTKSGQSFSSLGGRRNQSNRERLREEIQARGLERFVLEGKISACSRKIESYLRYHHRQAKYFTRLKSGRAFGMCYLTRHSPRWEGRNRVFSTRRNLLDY